MKSSKLPSLNDILNAKGMSKLRRNFLNSESSSDSTNLKNKCRELHQLQSTCFRFNKYHKNEDKQPKSV
jgi:hypothetical protein